MSDEQSAAEISKGDLLDNVMQHIASHIRTTKELRVQLDRDLQKLREYAATTNAVYASGSRETSIAITKLQESIMWLGMELKRLGAENPYPNSYKPENAVVDPTADGLKL